MKVLYITAHAPYGKGETFILEECLELKHFGVEVIILPRNPPRTIFNKKTESILENTVWYPLVTARMILDLVYSYFKKAKLRLICFNIVKHSRNLSIFVKNLLVLPKANYFVKLIRILDINHIHAHWGSTTSTMAYILSELTGVPWSLTLHRWDIAENNMLALKCSSAKFVRCISEDGKLETVDLIGDCFSNKLRVIHMGVKIPESSKPEAKNHRQFVIACPANLRSKKGHYYLVEACKILVESNITRFVCFIIGDGPLKKVIWRQIQRLGLSGYIRMIDRIPHGDLLRMYINGEVDAVVLPSIIDPDHEREGIPVALMEAMSYSIPVISTKTGGIPELLGGGAGILINQKSSREIAESVKSLMYKPQLAKAVGIAGHRRVKKEFNLTGIIKYLIADFGNCS